MDKLERRQYEAIVLTSDVNIRYTPSQTDT